MKTLYKSLLAIFIFYSTLLLIDHIIYIKFNQKFNSAQRIQKNLLYDDFVFDHRWIPGKTATDNSRGRPIVIQINNQKWPMSRDIACLPGSAKRVVCIGDSNTQCVVDEKYKWTTLLEQTWNMSHQNNIEVINTGTSSWSFMQYYLILDEVLSFRPKVILIGIDMTDLSNDAFYEKRASFDMNHLPLKITPFRAEQVVLTPTGSYAPNNNSRIASFLGLQYIQWFFWLQNIAEDNNKNNNINWFNDQWNKATQDQFNRSIRLIEFANKKCSDKGVKLLVISIPHLNQFQNYKEAFPHKAISQYLKQVGIPCLNLYDEIIKQDKCFEAKELYWPTDPTHFNEKGNKIAAELIMPFLRKYVH